MHQFINVEAEHQIVGGILKTPARIIPAIKSEMITIEHFADHRAQTIYRIAMELHAEGRDLHIKNLSRQPEILNLRDAKITHDISQIKTKYTGYENWVSYIPAIKKAKALRVAHASTSEAITMIESGVSPSNVATRLADVSQAITSTIESSTSWKTSEEAVRGFVELLQRIHAEGGTIGTPSGIHEIDRLTGGPAPEDLWVIAAPSSCGKTMLMVQIMNHFHSLGKNCLVFSFETNAEKIITRIISNRANINSKTILGKGEEKLTQLDFIKIKKAAAEIKESESLTICDNFDLTLESMMGIASQIKDRGTPIDLILVDYIQLVSLADSKGLSREQEVSRVSRSLKKMAKEHCCPVLSASQLNDDGAVRESRAIAQDADVLLKIDSPNGCIHLVKNRDGERGEELPLYMLGAYQRFIHNPHHQKTK